MKVLVTGGKGQLGQSIKKIAGLYPDVSFEYTDVEELDITNKEAISRYFEEKGFTHLVNCAAYTAVDKAEEDSSFANLLNATAVGYLSQVCEMNNCMFIHISTDYVFDGKNFKPYKESDPMKPESAYGKTKAGGEQEALKNCNKAFVIRTSWLYSEFGNNFLKTILRLSSERDKLTIVADQIGTPTYATHLAKAIMELIINEAKSSSSIYHFSNEGVASWYDFALEIVNSSGNNCEVLPIPTEAYPLPARRPYYSVMSKDLFSNTFDYKIPHWKDGLHECLKLI
ncbi:MAG: dTDP-4-dehydrorhamnose reductase [Bacteroidales bacterium]|nr:dTDP-4-dehydrorhamnose reductase [Bacteroidales bacterium]